MRLTLMLSMLSLLVVGCGPLSPAYYQPTGPTYSYFKKPGTTDLDVQKAMLECGTAPITERNEDMNTYFLAKKCLEESGYKSTVLSMEESCKLEHNAIYPACQSAAVIPKPSVERRLNSKYCQSAREMINEDSYQRCLSEDAVKYKRVTEKDCAYWYRKLVEECLP